MLYTITVFAENKPGVLYRIADLFLRRKVNIESLTVSHMQEEGLSRFTIVVDADVFLVEKIAKQLYRIIEVTKVIESKDDELIVSEVALIRVSAKTLDQRKEIEHMAQMAKGRIVKVSADSLVVEITGNEKHIDDLYALMRPFGIKEFIRSGRIVVFEK